MMCAFDGDRRAEFCETRTVVARKPHRCEECGRTIATGEKYSRAAGKWDGYFSTFAHCQQCGVAVGLLLRECNGFLYGGVCEDLEEHIGETWWSRDARRLVLGIKREWRFAGRLMNVPKLVCTEPKVSP